MPYKALCGSLSLIAATPLSEAPPTPEDAQKPPERSTVDKAKRAFKREILAIIKVFQPTGE